MPKTITITFNNLPDELAKLLETAPEKLNMPKLDGNISINYHEDRDYDIRVIFKDAMALFTKQYFETLSPAQQIIFWRNLSKQNLDMFMRISGKSN